MNPAALVECNDAALSKTEVSAIPGTSVVGKPLPTTYTSPNGPHLLNEIILMILAHVLAPTKYYFDNEPPINEMVFYSFIQPSAYSPTSSLSPKTLSRWPSKYSTRLKS